MSGSKPDNPRCIHLWVPGFEETGGIQHYSLCLLKALQQLYPDASVRVFSKNDLHRFGPRMHVFGKFRGWVRTLCFALSGVILAIFEKPDWVISTHPHFVKAMRPLQRLGFRCVTAAHGIETWGLLDGAVGKNLRLITGVIPVSAYTREVIYREANVAMELMPLVPNTFREDDFQVGDKAEYLLQRYGLRCGQPVMLTIARLSAAERYKGQDQIIQAMPELLKTLPDLRYLIGGRGDDERRLRHLATELGVEHQVIFTGFIPETELADHYRLSDLYVMPSTGEGFGIVYLESLACGRPCLVGNQDASPEAIDGGRLGLAVPPRDLSAITEAILSFFNRMPEFEPLRKPSFLHDEVVRLYGFEAFKESLKLALQSLGKVREPV